MIRQLVSGATAAALALGFAGIASAATPFNWTGFYIGGNVGGAWGQSPWTFDSDGAPYAIQQTAGWVGGPEVGFDVQAGSLVYGVVADIDATEISSALSCPNTDYNCYTRINWLGTARAKIGVVTASGLVVYGTGGLAFGAVQASEKYLPTDTAIPGTAMTGTGWTAGMGLSVPLNNMWTANAEFLHFDLGATHYYIDEPITLHESGSILRFGFDWHM